MPCFPLKSWRRGKKTKTAQSTDLSSAGLQWPITVHCGSRHRQWTQDEYQRARVDLTPGELKIVNDWTSKSKQKDWGTAMEEKWKRGREERYGPYEWDNATAMLCDYTYRCVWKRLDEEENCAEHRIVQIKDYARDLWVSLHRTLASARLRSGHRS